MGGQARPDRRVRGVLGPLQHTGQAAPVGLVPQIGRPRLGPGHDQAVEMAVPQIIEAGIDTAHMAPARIRARDIGQRVERQAHHEAVSCAIEQAEKLPFGRFQRRVRHIVDEADVEAARVGFTELDRRLPVPPLHARPRGVPRRISIQTDGHPRSSKPRLVGPGRDE